MAETTLNYHDFNLDRYSHEAHFFVPGAFESFFFVRNLAYNRFDPKIMKDKAIIDCVYGNVSMVWNGGRTCDDLYLNRSLLEQAHANYAEAMMPVRFVCTNNQLNEHDIHDRYANFVMDIFSDVPFEIVVADPRLEDYLRNKYKNAQFISSTTKGIVNQEDVIAELKKDYKYVCLDYRLNKQCEVFEAIPQELRSKVEILINEPCPIDCPMRKKHYELMSREQLSFEPDDNTGCPLNGKDLCSDEVLCRSNYIFNHQLENYLALGYNHFKLQGRSFISTTLATEIMPYLTKPRAYGIFIDMSTKQYSNFSSLKS